MINIQVVVIEIIEEPQPFHKIDIYHPSVMKATWVCP